MINLTPQQLRKAADIQEKIQKLQKELGQLLGDSGPAEAAESEAPKRRTISAAGRARMKAAQKARWAAIKTKKIKPVKKAKRKMTPAWKAALGRAWEARRAKGKAAGKNKA
jgi:hypothetical protein